MIAVDTSVVVPGLSAWHEHHESCRSVLDGQPRIVGHALVESFSVLTRLPAPFRMPTQLASELLSTNFDQPPLVLAAEDTARFVASLPQWRVVGGSVYDALIGATAAQAGAVLLTLDARAARTYQAVGADVRFL
jgi:predicted nucleic acid-binding protein